MKTDTLHILPQVKFISPNFDIKKINQYQLGCELSETHFYFFVKDSLDKSLIALESYHFPVEPHCHSLIANLEMIFGQHDFLKSLKWKSISITIDNQSFTLLPIALYKKEYINKYLQLAKGQVLEADEEVRTNIHPDLALINIYSSNRQLFNWFEEAYPLLNLQYQHLSSQLIDFALTSSRAQTAFLHFGETAFTMVVSINGVLKFCNRFHYKTSEDLVYFVLFVMNELEIEPDEIFIRLYGNIDKESEEFILLNQYLPKVKIGDSLNENIEESLIEKHRYLWLLV